MHSIMPDIRHALRQLRKTPTLLQNLPVTDPKMQLYGMAGQDIGILTGATVPRTR